MKPVYVAMLLHLALLVLVVEDEKQLIAEMLKVKIKLGLSLNTTIY